MSNPKPYEPQDTEISLGNLPSDLKIMHRKSHVGIGFDNAFLDKLAQVPPDRGVILVYDPWEALVVAVDIMSHAAACDPKLKALVDVMATAGEVFMAEYKKDAVSDTEPAPQEPADSRSTNDDIVEAFQGGFSNPPGFSGGKPNV